MPHELVSAFDAVQLPLCRKLCDMLNEQPQHRTERRGCGLTQATRLLADYINAERSPNDGHDLQLFNGFPARLTRAIAQRSLNHGWIPGWRRLAEAPAEVHEAIYGLPKSNLLLDLPARLDRVAQQLQFAESRLLLALIRDLLSGSAPHAQQLTFMPEKPTIGSCSQAEEFFLEIAHGKIRRGGHVNVFTDDYGRPLLVEKMKLGESHSALLLEHINIGGVNIPPGGLAALGHTADDGSSASKVRALPLSAIEQARFLRLTTLAVAPQERARAFSSQFKRQVDGNMLSPATTTLDDLRQFAAKALLGL